MKSIVLIVPYIGKWPLWFDAHLVSIAKNPSINWLFITDCAIPDVYPENVRFVPSTLESLNNKINDVLGVKVPLSPRKLCDVRPAYGEIFQEYISDYDFWGFCDVDIIWGNIRGYVSDDILSNYDIISSRKEAVAGHFTILKNNPEINSIYLSIPEFKELLSLNKLMRIDEEAFTFHLKNEKKHAKFKIWWEDYLMNHNNGKAHQEYCLDKWLWKEGKILEVKNEEPINEVMYLHFINWKRTMKYSEVSYLDNPKQFYISYNGMHYITHTTFSKAFNEIKNFFDGYYRRESRRIKKRKFDKLLKRIRRKLKAV
ncbi:DUF6625 family protein [Winogradskyella sediminis]|uniref:DUF6625 family protein n=1 Tax=Winogradskyella sediminis TaxID=1382466 RepID=UPI003AA7B20B